MYKLSLKQRMRVLIDGKWRNYGETWIRKDYIDNPFVNCDRIKESKIERELIKPMKSLKEKYKEDNKESE